jgi:hypothetical protein
VTILRNSPSFRGLLSVPDRLLTRLHNLAPSGDVLADGTVKILISQQQLADFLGVSRQVVNGYLREWQKQGRVALSRGSITLHYPRLPAANS